MHVCTAASDRHAQKASRSTTAAGVAFCSAPKARRVAEGTGLELRRAPPREKNHGRSNNTLFRTCLSIRLILHALKLVRLPIKTKLSFAHPRCRPLPLRSGPCLTLIRCFGRMLRPSGCKVMHAVRRVLLVKEHAVPRNPLFNKIP